MRFSITTNATLLTGGRRAIFRATTASTVAVSLDGGGATNDRMRPLKGGGGAYDRVLASARAVARLGRPRHLSGARDRHAREPRAARHPRSPRRARIRLGRASAAVLSSPRSAARCSRRRFRRMLREGMIACGRERERRSWRDGAYPFSNFETALHEIHRGTPPALSVRRRRRLPRASRPTAGCIACHRFVDDEECRDGRRRSAASTWPPRTVHLAERHVDRQEPCRSCWARYLCGGGCYHEVDRRGRIGLRLHPRLARLLHRELCRDLGGALRSTSPIPSGISGGACRERRQRCGAPVMSADDLKTKKLFPRNLTARADTLVRGNPVTTRPESGVENSWPGTRVRSPNAGEGFFPRARLRVSRRARNDPARIRSERSRRQSSSSSRTLGRASTSPTCRAES